MTSKFAVDTKVGRIVTTEEGRAELQELERWANRWGIEFNVWKCKVIFQIARL